MSTCTTEVPARTAGRTYSSRDAELAFLRGVALLNQGDPVRALAGFQEALQGVRTSSNRADVLCNMAVCHIRLGRNGAAIDLLSNAVETDPSVASDIERDQDFAPLLSDRSLRDKLPIVLSRQTPAFDFRPQSYGSGLKREMSKTFWKKVVPAFIFLLAAILVAVLPGVPDFLAPLVVVFLLIVVLFPVLNRLETGRFEFLFALGLGVKAVAFLFCMVVGTLLFAIVLGGITGQ